jgi:hypothetical protein
MKTLAGKVFAIIFRREFCHLPLNLAQMDSIHLIISKGGE